MAIETIFHPLLTCWRCLAYGEHSSLPFHRLMAKINWHLAKQCTCRVIWSFISTITSQWQQLLPEFLCCLCTLSPPIQSLPITAASSLLRPARLDRSYIRRTVLNFASAPPPPPPTQPPPPPAFFSPPPRVFPQGRLMKSSCKCNESIIKIKQLLNKARGVCFSLNDTALLNLPCQCKKDMTEFEKSFPRRKSTTSAASKFLRNCSNSHLN